MAMQWTGAVTSPQEFLHDYWQRQAVCLPQALAFSPMLDVDDLAGLATYGDVESTLIQTKREHGATRYDVTSGPFTDAQLSALGERDWTLLLHDVDTHAPQTAQLLDMLDFLPSWRIDNLMVSVAAPGGSVGPHADSYDVLLLQGDGERHWQLAPAGSGDAVAGHPLRLIEQATFNGDYHTQCGDILYVPPGVVHHGVAQTLCTTWSLGMQAPLLLDIAQLADAQVNPGISPDARYQDARIQPRQRGEILATDVAHLPITGATAEALVIALGVLVTQIKPHLRVAPCEPAGAMSLAPGSRLAWANSADGIVVFANGQYAYMAAAVAPLITAALLGRDWPCDNDADFTRWLAAAGALISTDNSSPNGHD